uniref:Respiratory burst oxidase protein B n=1 Tax=Arundo donax TaxID=35708 RepID=A0A0A9DTB3_ARUDO
MNEVQALAMHNERQVHNNEQVMRVPKGIEASQFVEWFWKLHQATAEPPGC